MKMHFFFMFGVLILIFSGCSSGAEETGNPAPEDILEQTPDADIFLYDGVVYANAMNLKRNDFNDFKKQEKLGEIERRAGSIKIFSEFTSSILPSGTPLYSTSEDDDLPRYIIADFEDENIIYAALIEG